MGGGRYSSLPSVSMCLNAGAMGRQDAESETLIPTFGGGFDVAHSLRGEGFDASEDGTGRGTPLVPVAYRVHGEHSTAMTGNGVARVADPVDVTRCLDSSGGYATNQGGNLVAQPMPHLDVMPTMLNGANTPAGHMARSGHNKDAYIVPVAYRTAGDGAVYEEGDVVAPLTTATDPCGNVIGFAQNQRDEVRLMYVAGALAAAPGAKQQTYMQQDMAVRRLTPVECERLQGFSDGYTAIPWRKKPAEDCPDGPRYKALGNSWAVPCARWIGQRIQDALA